jgi:hypothetical protein
MAPCSVKAYGRYLRCCLRPPFKVAICDLKAASSSAVSWEHEVLGEALAVTANLFVEALGAAPVEGRELGIEQHSVSES